MPVNLIQNGWQDVSLNLNLHVVTCIYTKMPNKQFFLKSKMICSIYIASFPYVHKIFSNKHMTCMKVTMSAVGSRITGVIRRTLILYCFSRAKR